MPRNFFRRIEVVFPVEDGVLRERIKEEILKVVLHDNVKARHLGSDGSYSRPALKSGEKAVRSQVTFIKAAEDQVPSPVSGRERSGKYARVKLAARPSRAASPQLRGK